MQQPISQPMPSPATVVAAESPSPSPSAPKRKRADDVLESSPRRVKTTADALSGIPASPTPSSKGQYDDLGFDPFAPHPGMTKEERKLARMIRNRNAAQASRDRKKEHVVDLENRVKELETQLAIVTNSTLTSPVASASLPYSASEAHAGRSPSPAPSHASTSTISPTQAESLSQARIASLEEENDRLRDRLEAEARRSGELKGRLEGVEKRFEGLERLLSTLVGPTPQSTPASVSPAPSGPPLPLADPIDWSSLLLTTPITTNFPSLVAPFNLASSANGVVAASSEPNLSTISCQSTSNRLVAREVSLPRTLALTLTARRGRARLQRRRRHQARISTALISPHLAWRAQLDQWPASTMRRARSLKRSSNGRCKRKDLGPCGVRKVQLMVLPPKKDQE